MIVQNYETFYYPRSNDIIYDNLTIIFYTYIAANNLKINGPRNN